jgi:hypothetical protein
MKGRKEWLNGMDWRKKETEIEGRSERGRYAEKDIYVQENKLHSTHPVFGMSPIQKCLLLAMARYWLFDVQYVL